ncbi:sulfotransferase [Coleofasciculus sp. LEGE 07092]|nr:sulfotransferase [Coleofasciculus sp. LEGE 07081]MBE9148543.1 sulfotransferase [Coleofasciculus sp. LEGE 07092]
MPNFLIIGAAKSGTTAFYQYLKQHPQIYMSPVKEPHFFAFEGENLNFRGPRVTINQTSITNIEAYRDLFQSVSKEVAVGEASALYLYLPKAHERIKHYVPNAKLIAILRHPVDRAYASFMQLIRDEREPITDFAQALQAEEKRMQENWGFLWRYQDLGFYSIQLKRYFEAFDQRQIKVYLYEDFSTDPVGVLQNIFQFLGVDDKFVPDMSIRPNVSGVPQNRLLHNFLKEPNPLKDLFKPLVPNRLRKRITTNLTIQNLTKPQLSSELRNQLLQLFREDILKLQDLIQRDLSAWLY